MVDGENKNIGKVDCVEPIMIMGQSFGIKLLSVYDFLKCEIMYKNLVDKLTSLGFDEVLCREVSEYACIVSMCLYDSDKQRVFIDGFSVLLHLTPDELKKIYGEYLFLHKKVINFDNNTSGILKNLKTNFDN